MPIKKSAKKYMRVTKRKTIRNKKIKGALRSAVKNVREAVLAGKTEDAKLWLEKAIKFIDKAAQKGVIKKNTAARKKSRLNKLVKNLVKK